MIEAVPDDRDILFLPDMFLGAYLERLTGRRMKIWPGECHVHAGIRPDDVSRMMEERPGHRPADPSRSAAAPASACMRPRRTPRWPAPPTCSRPRAWCGTRPRSAQRDFVVATETGILHRLRKEAPDKRFYAMSERAVCRYMKQITLPKLRDSLRDMQHPVTVPDEVAARARRAIERMVEIV